MSEHSDQPQAGDDDGSTTRRSFLTWATGIVGGLGGIFAAWPFLASWQPSARARALGAPVEIDITDLGEGELKREVWRGKPIWVLKRSKDMLDSLQTVKDELADPDLSQQQEPPYAENPTRSIKPDILVMVGTCTHLGCSPKYHPKGEDLDGPGFFCPCHGSKFDIAGRVYKGVPAPLNMQIPPHRYDSDTLIVIGEDSQEGGETS